MALIRDVNSLFQGERLKIKNNLFCFTQRQ